MSDSGDSEQDKQRELEAEYEFMTTNNQPDIDEQIDNLILGLVQQGSMFPRGKTINADMFPEAKTEMYALIEEVIGEGYAACDDLVPTKWNKAVYQAQDRLKKAQRNRLYTGGEGI